MLDPELALDPTTGDRHVAYVNIWTLQHSWETAGVWQTEAVVDSISTSNLTGFRLRVAADGHPVVAYARKGAVVCAVRGGGGWQRDTLDMLPGPVSYPIALDLDPTTGEPAMAWAKQSSTPGVPSTVYYARHSGGVWTTQLVDTTSSAWLNVALGIDGAGRPHIAWFRPRGDDRSGYVLTYGSGAGPDGPFVSAPVDSECSSALGLAMDRSNGEPRLMYYGYTGFAPIIRYAYRVPGGAWQSVDVGFASDGNPPAPALALDPAGNPFIGVTELNNIEPRLGGASDPNQIESCGGVFSRDVKIFYRAGGAGPAPFSQEYVNVGLSNAQCGIQSVASKAVGQAVMAWRVFISCPPYGLSTTTVTGPPVVGVGGSDLRGAALSPVWPNPARAGEDLRIGFALAREAAIVFVLHDLAGRRVATRSLATVSPGPHAISWSVPDLAPGHYWLTMRSDGQRIGTRSLVIMR
jgi:hypothetical protein